MTGMSIRVARVLTALNILFLFHSAAFGQSERLDTLGLARLVALGRLWGAVKYFHPALLSRPINWDSAVVAAVPRVIAARSTEEYAAALNAMLSALDDPSTHVSPSAVEGARPEGSGLETRWQSDSVLLISIPNLDDTVSYRIRAIAPLLRAAHQIIFDLRGSPPRTPGIASDVFSPIDSLLGGPSPVSLTVQRRTYVNFPTTAVVGGYGTEVTETLRTLRAGANRFSRLVFVVHPWTDIPWQAWALQQSGRAVVVLDGTCGNAPRVQGACEMIGREDTYRMSVGEGLEAQVTIAALVNRAHGVFMPDSVLSSVHDHDAPVRAALSLLHDHRRAGASVTPVFDLGALPENGYREMRYPPLPYRILAAYRWWNAIHYFYPYKHLIGSDWSAALAPSIRDLASASDSTEYQLAVRRMVARIQDSHGIVRDLVRGVPLAGAQPGILIRYIEGQPVVVYVAPPSASSGIAVGDVVLTIDGESPSALAAGLAMSIASSTPQSLNEIIAHYLLRGLVGSTAALRAQGPDHRVRTVTLARQYESFASLNTGYLQQTRGSILRKLPGNVGYADLARLTVAMVDSMFDMFRDTNAIIFDNRGYPHETAWAIASRLTRRDNTPVAREQWPIAVSPDTLEGGIHTIIQTLPKSDKSRYPRRTVLLIDERAISQAEHLGLALEAANGTTFVGSPTTGANGEVKPVTIPGGMVAFFTGEDVRHADGRQLQRIGLQPDVAVKPTIAGIRAGRDEVLERALVFLRTGGKDGSHTPADTSRK
jgi:C-terminal processing protease CtpA/Prc